MQKSRNNIVNILTEELKKPLPGIESQMDMVPKSKRNNIANADLKNAKDGGVLLLLYEKGEQLMIVFIERTKDGGVHSGQISFPGGKYEENDKDLVHTALREANEEVGIEVQKVKILGNLTKVDILASNFRVLPVIGYYQGNIEFEINTYEVASIIEVSLTHLLDKRNKCQGMVDVFGGKYEVPVFKVDNHQIWGATAMILNEFLQVINNIDGKSTIFK